MAKFRVPVGPVKDISMVEMPWEEARSVHKHMLKTGHRFPDTHAVRVFLHEGVEPPKTEELRIKKRFI